MAFLSQTYLVEKHPSPETRKKSITRYLLALQLTETQGLQLGHVGTSVLN